MHAFLFSGTVTALIASDPLLILLIFFFSLFTQILMSGKKNNSDKHELYKAVIETVNILIGSVHCLTVAWAQSS